MERIVDCAVHRPAARFCLSLLLAIFCLLEARQASAGSTNAITPNPEWQRALLISCSACNTENVKLAVTGKGNAVAVWTQTNPGTASPQHHYAVVAARYHVVTGTWSKPEILFTGQGRANISGIEADGSGNVIAVWEHKKALHSARYTMTHGTWKKFGMIDSAKHMPEDFGTRGAKLVVDFAGNAFIVTNRIVATYSRNGQILSIKYPLLAIYYDVARDMWNAPLALTQPGDSGTDFSVALDPAGNAVAVWSLVNGPSPELQATRYRKATGNWSRPRTLAIADIEQPKVGLDRSGAATVTWVQHYGDLNEKLGFGLFIARLDPYKDIWSKPLQLTTEPLIRSDLKVDVMGNAFVTSVYTLTEQYKWQGMRIDKATGKRAFFGPFIGLDAPASTSPPALAVDASGNAVVLWTLSAGFGGNLLGSRYDKATGLWEAPKQIGKNVFLAEPPAVKVDGRGRAIVVWSDSSGVHASRLAP